MYPRSTTFEPLEPKLCLSVSAAVTGGNLIVKGDADGAVEIVAVSSGAYRVVDNGVVIAIPLGLALVGIPARKAGYLSSQKLLDIVIERNLDRYVPLAVIVVLWALVTALLVQLLVEGGDWLMRRRQARRVRAASRA